MNLLIVIITKSINYLKDRALPFQILFLILVAPVLLSAETKYSITIEHNLRRIAYVQCSTTLSDITLFMDNSGSHHLKDGYAYYIRNLTVKEISGKEIPWSYKGDGIWELKSQSGRQITIEYQVSLEHDKIQWPHGPDEAPYIRDDCLFWTGRALFILTEDIRDIEVNFTLPPGWFVSSPWEKRKGKPNTFLVKSINELTDAFLLIGSHQETLIKKKGMEVLLASGKDLQKTIPFIKNIICEYIKYFRNLFGGAPQDRILLVMNTYNNGGGGVFGKSISILFREMPTEKNLGWIHLIAHELFHVWNGRAIKYQDVKEYWFSEGFTEYYSYIISSRLGIINERKLLNSLENIFSRYLTYAGSASIRDSGLNKTKRENASLIYGGGCVVALVMDIEIRNMTNNKKSLDNLMKLMYKEYADSQQKYTCDDILKIASKITNSDFSEFFKRYLTGTEVIPLNYYLNKCGLDIKIENPKVTVDQQISGKVKVGVSISPNMSSQEKLIFQGIFK